MSRHKTRNGLTLDEAIEHYIRKARNVDGVALAAYAWENKDEFIAQYERWVASDFRYKIEID